MIFNPDIHHRRSIRLPHYDYAQAGLYFVTICTHERRPLFGMVIDGKMVVNIQGDMIATWWHKLPTKFDNYKLHEFVVMPNHIHGIIEITNHGVGADPCVCPSVTTTECVNTGRTHGCAPINDIPLSQMVQWFKTMTTNAYLRGIKQNNWPPFNGKLWQRNYHEHIIRNEQSYLNIAQYIQTNPLRWQDDRYWTI